MKKKIMIFVALFLIVFSGCSHQKKTDNVITTKKHEVTTDINDEYRDESNERNTTTQKELNHEEILDDTTVTTEAETNTILATDNVNENSAPQILFLTLDDIAEVEKAYNNMDEEEFIEYISNHPKHYGMNGIESRSDAKKVLDEVKETTVVLLDGEKSNVSEMYFYVERNEIQQLIVVEDEKRLACYYYTPQNTNSGASKYGNVAGAVLVTEVKSNEATAEVYQFPSSELFFVDISLNDTVICYRVTQEQTIEEFEEDFERLQFAKIEELLSQ